MEGIGAIQGRLGEKQPTKLSMLGSKNQEWRNALGGWLKTFARHFQRAVDMHLTKEDVEIYGNGLADLSLNDLNRACGAAIKECGPWWPTCKEILECLSRNPIEQKKSADCDLCDGTGWLKHDYGVVRCQCRRVAQ